MRYIFLSIIMLQMVVGNVFAQKNSDNTDFFTLEKIWKTVEESNKDLKISQLELEKRNQIVRAAKLDYLPDIKLDAVYNRNSKMPVYKDSFLSSPEYFKVGKYGYGAGYELNFDIYDGGKKYRTVRKSKEERILAMHQHNAAKSNIKLITASLYYELLKSYKFKEFIEQEIESDKLQLKTIENFYNTGIVLKSDVLRASVKLSNIKLSLSEVENSIELIIQKLNLLMGREESEPLEIDTTEIPLQAVEGVYEDRLTKALQRNYMYQIASERIKIRKLDLQLSKVDMIPKVSLFSFYSFKYPQASLYPYSSNTYGFGQIGVKLTIPIDAFYKSSHKVKATRFAYQQEQISRDIFKDQLSEELKSYSLELDYIKERIETAKENISRVAESVRVIRNAYYNQQLTLTDLLDAETQLLEAKFEHTSAEISMQTVYLQLQEVLGIL